MRGLSNYVFHEAQRMTKVLEFLKLLIYNKKIQKDAPGG